MAQAASFVSADAGPAVCPLRHAAGCGVAAAACVFVRGHKTRPTVASAASLERMASSEYNRVHGNNEAESIC